MFHLISIMTYSLLVEVAEKMIQRRGDYRHARCGGDLPQKEARNYVFGHLRTSCLLEQAAQRKPDGRVVLTCPWCGCHNDSVEGFSLHLNRNQSRNNCRRQSGYGNIHFDDLNRICVRVGAGPQ